MNLPNFCIKRPVFATVLSLILIVIGVMGYQNLHTRFFPSFTRNRIFIMANYPGASASLVENSITTPLEKSLSGLEGIDAMTSVSSQGTSTIKLKVRTGTNLYQLTNKVRNQIAMAASTLPAAVKEPLVQTGHGSMDLMDIGFSIQGNKLIALRDYLDRYVINRIQQLSGISAISVMGANKYAMRVTLHPQQMAALNVSVSDIQEAISNNNLQLPAGMIKTATMDFPITAHTALHTAKQFGNIIIKKQNNKLIRLKELATVKLGNDTGTQSIVRANGKRAILLSIYNTTNANPIDTSKRVRALLTKIKAQMPSNIKAAITFDEATYMKASIAEVYKAIGLAIFFVAIIIFLGLGKIRSAMIPIVTIPICLLATLGLMYFLGFSINIITLLAIVLSVGLVVDDAIVVLENIHRHIEQGMTRMNAALKGSKEIAVPIIAMTLTLAAVYAPIGLIQGSVSHIFESFAFTLACAVIISGFVSLTLSPMMCSKFLAPPSTKKTNLNHWIDHSFHCITNAYQKSLGGILKHRLIIILITAGIAVSGYFLLASMPKVFMPKEDMGFLVTLLNSPNGTNNQHSEKQLKKLNGIILAHKAVKTNVTLTTEDSTSSDNKMIFSTLQPYSKRKQSANQLSQIVNTEIKKQAGLNAITFAPSFGGSNKYQLAFYIMAPTTYKNLYHSSHALIKRLDKYPGLRNLHSDIQFNDQQYQLNVNRQLAGELQVNVRTIDSTLADLLGGSVVSTFNLDGETYNVDMQAANPYLSNINKIGEFQVPSLANQLIPLANLVTIKPILTQTNLLHYNRLRAALISGELATGYTLGNVVSYLQKALPKELSDNVKYAFTGQAKRIVDSSNTMADIFGLALVFIYLVLSAQFESFLDPLIILLAVPLSIVGALASLKLVSGSINIYTVIGLVTLVGLIAKHGILITQFANKLQQAGVSAKDALIQAASIRLRPILMTTAAMTFGALPLIFATGASANSREQIGIVIVGGLVLGTFFSLILVPITYSYMAQFKAFMKRKLQTA